MLNRRRSPAYYFSSVAKGLPTGFAGSVVRVSSKLFDGQTNAYTKEPV